VWHVKGTDGCYKPFRYHAKCSQQKDEKVYCKKIANIFINVFLSIHDMCRWTFVMSSLLELKFFNFSDSEQEALNSMEEQSRSKTCDFAHLCSELKISLIVIRQLGRKTDMTKTFEILTLYSSLSMKTVRGSVSTAAL